MKNIFSGLASSWKEARNELAKVSWPTREDLTNYTGVVILSVVIMSLFLWLVDSGIMFIVKKVAH
ncbi:MAG: preprotein translocase subunit SecE [Erysipelotrichia bacterium]|nr:preprotein translocase subunit SecE [Erysipelotrichia bacterium]